MISTLSATAAADSESLCLAQKKAFRALKNLFRIRMLNPGLGVILFCLANAATVAAQVSSREFKWAEKGKYDAVADTFHSEDAILVSKDVYFTVEMNAANAGKDVHSNIFTHLKLKILTPAGIRTRTQINIPNYTSSEIRTLDARTIKPDGTVIDLNAADIHEMKVDIPNGEQNGVQLLRFSIPGVEIGDEVEIVILQTTKRLYSYDEVFLNDEASFCLHSSYTKSLPLGFVTETKCYNNMPRPRIDTIKGQRVICWRVSNLPPKRAEELCVPEYEFPFMRYAVRKIPYTWSGTQRDYQYDIAVEPASWLEYAKRLNRTNGLNSDFLQARITKHFNDQFDNYLTYSRNPDTLQRITRFFTYVHDHIHVIDVSESEYENSVDYYLKNNQVMESLMFSFFDRMFKELKLNYFLGLAKNRYTGEFDKEFVTIHSSTQEFMGFEFKNHFYYFFLPGKKHIYEFGEVPIELGGTDAILISRNNIESPVRKFTFPVSDKQRNFSKTNVFLNIELKKKSITRKDRQSRSGCVSTNERFGLISGSEKNEEFLADMLRDEKENNSGYVPDSAKIVVAEKTNPFLFTTEKNFHPKEGARQIDNNMYAVSVSGLIRHTVLPYSGGKRTTVYYPRFCYSDVQKIYLVFDAKVELMNADQLKNAWTGGVGTYALSATQINETTIMLDSNYDVNATSVLPADYPKIGELNAEALKAASLQVVVKVKD